MTSCDISSFGSCFQSKRNKRRLELDYQAFDKLAVGQRVRTTKKSNGKQTGKVTRFSEAAGRFFADVEFQLRTIKFLKMIEVEALEVIEPRDDINLTCRRNKANKSLAL